MTIDSVRPRKARHLSYLGFAVIVIIYLFGIIQLGGYLFGSVGDESDMASIRGLIFTMLIPLGLALIFTYAVVAGLGWTRRVLVDDRPVSKWVWVVPVLLVVSILLGIDYSALSEKGWGYVLLLLIVTQFVGWGEEGMFRGIGVTMLRDHGLSEGKVALWSSVIFGAAHLSNIFTSGTSAIAQAVVVSFAGYFFYLTRRVSGSNAVNSVLHGFFDFALLSGTAVLVDQQAYAGAIAPIAVYVVLALVLLIRRRSIEPSPV